MKSRIFIAFHCVSCNEEILKNTWLKNSQWVFLWEAVFFFFRSWELFHPVYQYLGVHWDCELCSHFSSSFIKELLSSQPHARAINNRQKCEYNKSLAALHIVWAWRQEPFNKTAPKTQAILSECSQPQYIGDIFQNAVNLQTALLIKSTKSDIRIINQENKHFVNASLVF